MRKFIGIVVLSFCWLGQGSASLAPEATSSQTLLPWVGMSSVYAQKLTCFQLFNRREFIRAATCFQNKAKKMKHGRALNTFQRFQKGRLLRNIAFSYKEAAKRAKDTSKSSLLYEKAYKTLQQYMAEKLCRKRYRCRSIEALQLQLLKKIQYAQLTIMTGPIPAYVEVKGHHFQSRKPVPPYWNQRVRPGRYKLIVSYSGQKPQERAINVPPGEDTIEVFKPLRQKKVIPVVTKPSPLPWVVLGVGAAAIVGGGLLIGLAHQSQSDGVQALAKSRAWAQEPESVRAERTKNAGEEVTSTIQCSTQCFQTAKQRELIGWIVAGTGAAVTAAGTLWLLLRKKPKPPTRVSVTPTKALPLASTQTTYILFSTP